MECTWKQGNILAEVLYVLCQNKDHFIQQYKVKYLRAKGSRKIHNISICEKVKQNKSDNNRAGDTGRGGGGRGDCPLLPSPYFFE